MIKKCFKCGRVLDLSQFYRHSGMADGYLGKCKDCARKDVAENYAITREAKSRYERERNQRPERQEAKRRYDNAHRSRNSEKAKARRDVGNAIRDGRLVRQPCRVCGERAQAHHDDYSKPLEVDWLCFKHHREHHNQIVVSENEIGRGRPKSCSLLTMSKAKSRSLKGLQGYRVTSESKNSYGWTRRLKNFPTSGGDTPRP